MAGWRNVTGETTGPKRNREVCSASHVRDTHSSSESLFGGMGLVK